MITGNSASNLKFRFKPQIPLPFTSIPVKMENHWLHLTVRVWVDYKNLTIVMHEGYSITFSVCVCVSVTDFEDGFISPNG